MNLSKIRDSWMFRKPNLSLRAEIIVNIALLMMAAILLIGFTLSKINERGLIHEKIRYGEAMIQDFQAILDFLSTERKVPFLFDPLVRRDLGDFLRHYAKGKRFHELTLTDEALTVVAAMRPELVGQVHSDERLRNAIGEAQFRTRLEQSGNFLTPDYKRISLYSPLWASGKVVGGIQIGMATEDVAKHLLESRNMILTAIVLDAVVLIAFGSFLLSRVLVKPIQELVRLTQKIAEGDFNQKIEVHSKNEIGQLISSFNRMTERLKENQEDLETYLDSLESTNKKLKQAQEELIRTEKLVSIGRFAAGVAHEVGNPLGAILGYTSILQRDELDRDEAGDYLRRIEKEIERINRIVRELLDFARPRRVEIHEIMINAVIESAISLLSYQKSFRNISTRLELRPELPMIKGDETQLSQVFINIVLNAVDAMPGGGTLTIHTEEYVVEDPLVGRLQRLYSPRRRGDPVESNYSHLRRPDLLSVILTKFSKGDRLVKVRISDTGTGIKKEDLEQIFDPFFTTKAPDRGTGLGLSVSLRIIESMGGEIRVESEVGKGSSFELYFPAVM